MTCKLQNLIVLHANYSTFIQQVVINYITNQQGVLTDTVRLDLIVIMKKYQTRHTSTCNK